MNFDEQTTGPNEPLTNNNSDLHYGILLISRSVEGATKRDMLIGELKRNLCGCDFILCVFIAALRSYRKDRCLRPFPPFFRNKEDGKDFGALINVCDKIPPLRNICDAPNSCSDDVVDLLVWLFLEKSQFGLKRTDMAPMKIANGLVAVWQPHYVFEVCYQPKIEEAWARRKGDKGIILAYHGSAVDNFYSILNVGLQQHFSVEKEVLFGNGIYLSSELSVSVHYAPFGMTWRNSWLGQRHSVIAMCEVINDIDKVKCKDSNNKRRSVNQNSLGEIPEKYFVVTDSEMVRVKYLMVYREKSLPSVTSFMRKHLFFVLITSYFIMILFVGKWQNY